MRVRKITKRKESIMKKRKKAPNEAKQLIRWGETK